MPCPQSGDGAESAGSDHQDDDERRDHAGLAQKSIVVADIVPHTSRSNDPNDRHDEIDADEILQARSHVGMVPEEIGNRLTRVGVRLFQRAAASCGKKCADEGNDE